MGKSLNGNFLLDNEIPGMEKKKRVTQILPSLTFSISILVFIVHHPTR
jgi:hypothetical protein